MRPGSDVTSSLRIVVSGQLAQYPLGGVAWDYLQYPVGLARLGHDVYYVEDSGQWPYHPGEKGRTDDCSYNVQHLGSVLGRFGLEDRWAFRCPSNKTWYGLTEDAVGRLMVDADLVINVSGTQPSMCGSRPDSPSCWTNGITTSLIGMCTRR